MRGGGAYTVDRSNISDWPGFTAAALMFLRGALQCCTVRSIKGASFIILRNMTSVFLRSGYVTHTYSQCKGPGSSIGSGVILDAQGSTLTHAYVVMERAHSG